MKRYIKQKLYAGINIDDNGSIYFNWNQDSNDDIVYLSTDTSATFDSDNVRYVYGYEYNTSNKSSQK